MKRKLSITLAILILSSLLTFQGIQIVKGDTGSWAKVYGGTNDDRCFSVVQTSDGGYALAGDTKSSGAGSWDSWLVKTDSAGNQLWNKTYGGPNTDDANSVVQTNDGGYALAGSTYPFNATTSDIWLLKTDATGEQLWNKTYGGTLYEYAVSIVQTTDGGYALAGVTTAWLTGTSDFWLVKTDSSGNQLWNKTYGGTGDDYANYMIQTADGGYMLAGTTDSFGAGGDDFWLVKTDATGNQVWNKTFGGNGDDFLNSVIRTADGGYALVGGTRIFGASIGDAWLIKIDASGKQLWNKTYGGPNNDEGTSLVQTSDGGYAFVGDTSSYGAGNDDFLMIRTDSLGNQLWNLTYGGISREWAYSIIKTSDGGYALAGLTYSFGNGGSDFLLVKLAPETTIPEFTTWTFLSIFLASTLCIFAFKRKTSNHQQQMKRKT